MLHEKEKANLEQTLERTRAAMGAFWCMEGELRTIRRGMAPGAERSRVEEMLRLTRETVAGLERKLLVVQRELARAVQSAPRSMTAQPW